ncbi:MAG: hypothetical protein HOH66_01095 [Rhodospirillaceae bacterium]|nr:hypothetical protein [Rhodospirillaceae bacterium]
MTTALRTILAFFFAAALLVACGDPDKAEIVEKSRGVETSAALRDKLGDPDDIDKLGPIEKWTYKASDGSVVFVIAGDRVTIEATGN